MISKKEDYSYLLDDLGEVSNNYSWNNKGEVVDLNNVVCEDSEIELKIRFFTLYSLAYRYNDSEEENTLPEMTNAYKERILSSYNIFNYFINTCLCEYRIYNDLGTGKVMYYPYQKIADFFFGTKELKSLVLDYLKSEIELEECKKRVK